MKEESTVSPGEVDRLFQRLHKEAEAGGYHFNPDTPFTKELVKGLLVNEKRYGYQSCPCRLASGVMAEDLDITCPCDYRDADLADYGTCYCGLYVSKAVIDGEKKTAAIPERRRRVAYGTKPGSKKAGAAIASVPLPVWRCRVCGYLCAREQPPETCPICKAKKDRFENHPGGSIYGTHWLPLVARIRGKGVQDIVDTILWLLKEGQREWSGRAGLNCRPLGPEPSALPDCATPR